MKSFTIIPAALAFAMLSGAASAQPIPPDRTPDIAKAVPMSPDRMASDAAMQPAPPPARSAIDNPPPPPPPPPGGPRAERAPPPPPRGPSIRVERDAGGTLRLDVHCGDVDSAKSCADTTLAVFDKVNAVAPSAK